MSLFRESSVISSKIFQRRDQLSGISSTSTWLMLILMLKLLNWCWIELGQISEFCIAVWEIPQVQPCTDCFISTLKFDCLFVFSSNEPCGRSLRLEDHFHLDAFLSFPIQKFTNYNVGVRLPPVKIRILLNIIQKDNRGSTTLGIPVPLS